MLKLLFLNLVELNLFAVFPSRWYKKQHPFKITSSQLVSKVTSCTEGECCFFGRQKEEDFNVSQFLGDLLI